MKTAILPAGTARSGVTVAGAKIVAPTNPIRTGMSFQNTSDTDMRLTEDGTEASASNGYLIEPAALVTISTNRAVSVYCAAADKPFASTET